MSDWLQQVLVCFPAQKLDSEPLIVPVHPVDSQDRKQGRYPTAHDDPCPEDHQVSERHAADARTKAQPSRITMSSPSGLLGDTQMD